MEILYWIRNLSVPKDTFLAFPFHLINLQRKRTPDSNQAPHTPDGLCTAPRFTRRVNKTQTAALPQTETLTAK
jgi:hypothetical protein